MKAMPQQAQTEETGGYSDIDLQFARKQMSGDPRQHEVLNDDQLEDLFGGIIDQPHQEDSDNSKDDLLESADVSRMLDSPSKEEAAPEERKVSQIELTNMIKD